VSPAPNWRHQELVLRVADVLRDHVRSRDLG
jgi:hypothetical protein